MHITPAASSKPDYAMLVRQVDSILEGERDLTANAAQFSAFIYDTIAELNWAGFYLTRPAKQGDGKELLVGPFQGKVACARIPFGRGVCGAAAAERRTMLVPDVEPVQRRRPARPGSTGGCIRGGDRFHSNKLRTTDEKPACPASMSAASSCRHSAAFPQW
jgi:putative methionine-R-sulfoxide reductase with GAF domain